MPRTFFGAPRAAGAMRRIVVFDNVSADGWFADAKGGLDWVVHDPELDRAVMAEGGPPPGAFLFGRRTYEMFAAFWPHVDQGPTGPHGEPMSPELRKMAKTLNATPKVVFSRTLKEASWKPTRILPSLDPREVARMKQQPGGDMMVFGSGSIVSQLTEQRLIDEYQLVVNPVLLGSGKALVDGFSEMVGLRLEEARSFPSGNVLLRYTLAGD